MTLKSSNRRVAEDRRERRVETNTQPDDKAMVTAFKKHLLI